MKESAINIAFPSGDLAVSAALCLGCFTCVVGDRSEGGGEGGGVGRVAITGPVIV